MNNEINMDHDNNNRLKLNTIRFLCNYKTHLQTQIQRYKDNFCNTCYNELSFEDMSLELSLVNDHVYNICNHKWENDYIEINEEMHKLVYCVVCYMKKNL